MGKKKMPEEKQIVTFDFLIDALMQHEKRLSNLAIAMEKILKYSSDIGELADRIQKANFPKIV